MPNVKRQTLFLNSAVATSKDLTIGRAIYIMDPPLRFGSEHKGHTPEISVHSVSYTNFFINISAALSNNHIFYSDDSKTDEKYDIKIGDGSYSIEALNQYVSKAQAEVVGSVKFQFLPNYSTNGSFVQFGSEAGWFVYFKAAVSPFVLLGFNSGDYVPATKASIPNDIELSPNVSQFNNITAVNVTTNLSNSTYYGGKKGDVLFESRPIVPIGSVQTDTPNNLIWADSDALQTDISEVIVQLKDQNGTGLDLNAENFSVSLSIRA